MRFGGRRGAEPEKSPGKLGPPQFSSLETRVVLKGNPRKGNETGCARKHGDTEAKFLLILLLKNRGFDVSFPAAL